MCASSGKGFTATPGLLMLIKYFLYEHLNIQRFKQCNDNRGIGGVYLWLDT
jgi:hypothetical protein